MVLATSLSVRRASWDTRLLFLRSCLPSRDAAAAAREPLSQTIGEAVRLNVAPETEVKMRDEKGGESVAKARELVRRPLIYFSEPGIYQSGVCGTAKIRGLQCAWA